MTRKYKDVGPYCLLTDEDACECGRQGEALLKCKKPLSPERMKEVWDKLSEPVTQSRKWRYLT